MSLAEAHTAEVAIAGIESAVHDLQLCDWGAGAADDGAAPQLAESAETADSVLSAEAAGLRADAQRWREKAAEADATVVQLRAELSASRAPDCGSSCGGG